MSIACDMIPKKRNLNEYVTTIFIYMIYKYDINE